MLLLLDHSPSHISGKVATQPLVDIQKAVLTYRSHHLDGATDLPQAVTRLLDLAHQDTLRDWLKSPSTIHISAVDTDGLACSISASAGYGSGVMVEGTGLWLNNSMGEIDLHPQGVEDLSPGERLVSNMAPTIARRSDGAMLAIGSPGASRITTAIAQVLLNLVKRGMDLDTAIAHPRLHVEQIDGQLRLAYEPGLEISQPLAMSCYSFPQTSMYFGGVQAALWEPDTGLTAAADARRAGAIARAKSL
jgi:gamma-glutamyltranspeptidase/glutathione hydrolase